MTAPLRAVPLRPCTLQALHEDFRDLVREQCESCGAAVAAGGAPGGTCLARQLQEMAERVAESYEQPLPRAGRA